MLDFFKKYSFADLDIIDMQELKKRVKFLVIDDEKDSFPTKQVQNFGFTLEYWNLVTTENLRRLENSEFDVIILDIEGIIDPELGSLNGIDLLKLLKEKNNKQIIYAFSGNKFDINQGEFWKQADGFFNKPIVLLEIKEELEKLIEDNFSPLGSIKRIKKILDSEISDVRVKKKIENIIASSIKKNKEIDYKKILKLGLTSISGINSGVETLISIYNRFAHE